MNKSNIKVFRETEVLRDSTTNLFIRTFEVFKKAINRAKEYFER